MSYNKILSEISNPIRMNLLLLLDEKKSTISELKEKIGDISHSEISRHIGRLAKQNLIAKETIPGRNYELTYFAKLIVKLFKPIDFVLKKSEYFINHKIEDIPESLLLGLQELESSELITGTGNLLFKGKDLLESANKQLWIMTDNPFPYDITVKDVFLIIPPKMLNYGREVNHEITKYQVHTIPEVHLCIIISDVGQGFIFFPNLEGPNPDFNSGFYTVDPKGIKYLKRLFNHFWDNSNEFLFSPDDIK